SDSTILKHPRQLGIISGFSEGSNNSMVNDSREQGWATRTSTAIVSSVLVEDGKGCIGGKSLHRCRAILHTSICFGVYSTIQPTDLQSNETALPGYRAGARKRDTSTIAELIVSGGRVD